jgi:hypothetical protein
MTATLIQIGGGLELSPVFNVLRRTILKAAAALKMAR